MVTTIDVRCLQRMEEKMSPWDIKKLYARINDRTSGNRIELIPTRGGRPCSYCGGKAD